MTHPVTGQEARALLVVRSDIAAAQDAEFNAWYDQVHIPDVLARPHWLSCRRYRLASEPRIFPPASGSGADPTAAFRYLAVWEVDTDDVVDAQRSLETGLEPLRAAGRLRMADQMTGRVSSYYVPLGPTQPPSANG